MADVGKATKGACPACPQMIITNGQQQSSLCYIYLSQYIDKCQEKILYIVYINAYRQPQIVLKSNFISIY
jgi:hypothetical protein